jgi:hypothetical protein
VKREKKHNGGNEGKNTPNDGGDLADGQGEVGREGVCIRSKCGSGCPVRVGVPLTVSCGSAQRERGARRFSPGFMRFSGKGNRLLRV